MAPVKNRLTQPKSLLIWVVGLGLLGGALARILPIQKEFLSHVVLVLLCAAFGYATWRYSKQEWTATEASRFGGRVGGTTLISYLTAFLSWLIPAYMEI